MMLYLILICAPSGQSPATPVSIYVQSYYALVEKEPCPLKPNLYDQVDYRIKSATLSTLYIPTHYLDRLLRPNYWKPEYPDLVNDADFFRGKSLPQKIVTFAHLLKLSFLYDTGLHSP